ncbi:MAG: NAD-dependent epimerase/dehydratase family protein [Rhodospirillales bacterium]|nr:NAD-dependent epimerase/dehydratase family protein [Rhodospirillales bacterium]
MQRILVTGGTGFIGAALVRKLANAGHAVRVVDNNSRGMSRRLDGITGRVELHVADVRNAESLSKIARDVDCVIHLAAVNGTEFFYSNPELVLDVGVRGMLATIDACRANGIRNLVVASSSEVYQTPPIVPTDEQAPLSIPDVLNPRYSYAGSKLISELIAMNYGRSGFERVVVFRPHNVYGADMGWEHVIPHFILRAAELVARTPTGKITFPIQGDGQQTRSFVHIDDFTDGLATIIERGKHLEIYHIGTTEEIEVAALARLIVGHFDREVELQPTDEPAGATRRRCPNITKLRSLGFTPKIPLSAGLPGVIDWYVKNAHSRAMTDQRTSL